MKKNFIIGFALNFASIASYVALTFWLGITIQDLLARTVGDPWRFYGFSLGVWLATAYMYVISFFRTQWEESLNRQFKELVELLPNGGRP